MVTVISSKTVRARKPHRCSCCWAVCVQPGDEYKRDVCVNDGRVYTWVKCPACADLLHDVWDWAGWPDEGVSADHYAEWAHEMKAHDERAAAYLVRAGGGE